MFINVTNIYTPIPGFKPEVRNGSSNNFAPKENKDQTINDENTQNQKDVNNPNKLANSSQEAIKKAKIQQEVSRLQAIENNVIAHEAAHKAVGGTLAGPASYSYTRGPDGKNYITGGEVSIDISEGRTPEETIRKMQQVRAAALAPADPSPQDYRVAATATQIEMAARSKMLAEKNANISESDTIKNNNNQGEKKIDPVRNQGIKLYNNIQNHSSLFTARNLISIG